MGSKTLSYLLRPLYEPPELFHVAQDAMKALVAEQPESALLLAEQ